jgi:hypothetical protein
MTPSSLKKQSWEELWCSFDTSSILSTADALSSASVYVYDSAKTNVTASMISGTPHLIGNKVFAKIIGGTSGKRYNVQVRITTTDVNKIEDDLILLVKDIT